MIQGAPPTALAALAPLFALSLGAAAVLMLSVAGGEKRLAAPGGVHLLVVALVSLAAAAAALVNAVPPGSGVSALQGGLWFDGLGLWFGMVCLVGCGLCLLTAVPVLTAQGSATGEYVALALLSTAGAVAVGLAGDLLALFLAIELMSVAAYVLAGYRRSAPSSQEAALKYFLYGSFASATMLFGIALVYGESGRVGGRPTLLLQALLHRVHDGELAGLGQVGLAFVLSGLCFKVAAAPFHLWAPDVYEGAPTASAGFLSVVVKAAGFAGLIRFAAVAYAAAGSGAAGGHAHLRAVQLLSLLAACSVVVGNLLALRQQQVKRLLAYSGVAHAGYVLVGVVAMVEQPQGNAVAAMAYYLLGYAAMALGAFAVLAALDAQAGPRTDFSVERLAGMGRHAPGLGLAAAICLLGLAGIPPTCGFFGKAALFSAALASGHAGLVALAALCSVVGAYSYLRLLAVMFMRRHAEEAPRLHSAWLQLGLAVCAGLTLGLGVGAELPLALARATLSTWWPGV